jgi:hypothetical protein
MSMAYIQARRGRDGGWRLFYRGTENEVYAGRVFADCASARKYAAAKIAAATQEFREARGRVTETLSLDSGR